VLRSAGRIATFIDRILYARPKNRLFQSIGGMIQVLLVMLIFWVRYIGSLNQPIIMRFRCKQLVFVLLCWPMFLTGQALPNLASQVGTTDRIVAMQVLHDDVGVYVLEIDNNSGNRVPELIWLIAVKEGQEIWRYQLAANASMIDIELFATRDGGVAVACQVGDGCGGASTDIIVLLWLDRYGQPVSAQSWPRPGAPVVVDGYINRMWHYQTEYDAFVVVKPAFPSPTSDIVRIRKSAPSVVEFMFNIPNWINGLSGVAIDPTDNNCIWVVGDTVIYRYQDGGLTHTYPNMADELAGRCVSISPDGRYLLIPVNGSRLHTIEVRDAAGVPVFNPVSSTATDMGWGYSSAEILPSGQILAVLYAMDIQNIYFVWPSVFELHESPDTIAIDVPIADSYLSYPDNIVYADGVLSVFSKGVGYNSAVIKNYDLLTGSPIGEYMDVAITDVQMLPGAWSYINALDTTSFWSDFRGCDVTIRNNGPMPLHSVHVFVSLLGYNFNFCESMIYSHHWLHDIDLGVGESSIVHLDGFINPKAFIYSQDTPVIEVWTTAPNNLPDSDNSNNYEWHTNFFDIVTPPGQFRVFPNPNSTDELMVSLEQLGLPKANFQIYNAQGQFIQDQSITAVGDYYRIPIHSLAPGVYVLQHGGLVTRFVRL
jgi:hypothetical protein